MNDYILNGDISKSTIQNFKKYIEPKSGDINFNPQLEYWIKIKSQEEFPIRFLLEEFAKIEIRNKGASL